MMVLVKHHLSLFLVMIFYIFLTRFEKILWKILQAYNFCFHFIVYCGEMGKLCNIQDSYRIAKVLLRFCSSVHDKCFHMTHCRPKHARNMHLYIGIRCSRQGQKPHTSIIPVLAITIPSGIVNWAPRAGDTWPIAGDRRGCVLLDMKANDVILP